MIKRCLCLSLVLCGCGWNPMQPANSTSSQPMGVVNGTDKWKIEAIKSDNVEISPPRVIQDGNELIIEGTVQRAKGFDGVLDETVQVTIFDPSGDYLDGAILALSPRVIPKVGERLSTYRMHYGWIPPQGAKIVVQMGGEAMRQSGGGASGARGFGNPNVVNSSLYTRTPQQQTTPRQTMTPMMPTAGSTGVGRTTSR